MENIIDMVEALEIIMVEVWLIDFIFHLLSRKLVKWKSEIHYYREIMFEWDNGGPTVKTFAFHRWRAGSGPT